MMLVFLYWKIKVLYAFFSSSITYCISVEHGGTCPTISGDVMGACVEECSHDGDCQTDEKCCSNGCGHECHTTIQSKYN